MTGNKYAKVRSDIVADVLPDKNFVLKIHKKEGGGDRGFWNGTGRRETDGSGGKRALRYWRQDNGGLVRYQRGPYWDSMRGALVGNEGLVATVFWGDMGGLRGWKMTTCW